MPTAILSARRDAGGGLLLVALDVDPGRGRAYTTPGQYVEVRTGSAQGFFVLASQVGVTPWELLVKNAGDAADALVSLPLGSQIEVKGPMGAGFAVARVVERSVVVAVVGSALAVARPVLATRIAEGVAGNTFLFLGMRAPTDLPIAEEVEAWSEQGVNVVLCLSRSELDHHREVLPKAQRAVGYVQAAVARAVATGALPAGALAVAAGPDAMIADMRALSRTSPIEVVTNV